MSEHQHEKWQLLDSAQGGQYCGACGDHVPVIPDAAVEAAVARLAILNSDAGDQLADHEWARELLEAAAPHMRFDLQCMSLIDEME